MSVYGERVEKLVEGLDAMLDHMRSDYKSWSEFPVDMMVIQRVVKPFVMI